MYVSVVVLPSGTRPVAKQNRPLDMRPPQKIVLRPNFLITNTDTILAGISTNLIFKKTRSGMICLNFRPMGQIKLTLRGRSSDRNRLRG